MPFNMFKALSGSRNRAHRGDPAIYDDYPQGYPPAEDFQQESAMRSQPRGVLRRSSMKRREPLFTPLPSRVPTDADDLNHDDSFIQVDSPNAVLGGALNARPGKLEPALPPLESPLSESLSEREHRELAGRLHDGPGLFDRPPPLQHASSFHSGRRERVDPGDPTSIVVTPPSRSSASESGHTFEALHTPSSAYPQERVIPPLPRNYTGSYMQGSRSPTDIYGSHAYEIAPSHRYRDDDHNQEFYLDKYGRPDGYNKDSPIYYVIPGGMNVIFQDEHGNEITRVGDFSGRSRPLRPGPFVVQDEKGRELYRYDNYHRGSHQGYSDPQIVQIDTYPPHHRRYSSRDSSYRRGYDHFPDHRDPRGHRERDWRDHRDHRYRGYDFPEYRDHKGYKDYGRSRDHGGYRDHGGHRDYDGYRERGDYRHHGRPEDYVPGRASSRASHGSYNHTGQLALEMPVPTQQYTEPIPEDRRSGYAASHTSLRHPEDEADITNGLDALHL